MSRTDKTRPWWARLADTPMATCVPVHDHRFGPCTLPAEVSPGSATPGSGCRWGCAADHLVWRDTKAGIREWRRFQREERRRDRHRARRELRAHRGEE
ncbi:hypothetical protein [Saccharothrix sp. HUAS TT1]|uniref:hypothetical protein n=1 Tax=unclassified Saccharothrix TaxID=2593673 RepID=UPI00345B6188